MIGQRNIILAHALCEAPRIQDGVVLEAGWSKVRISSMVLVHLLILREGNMQILLFNYPVWLYSESNKYLVGIM